MPRKKVAETHNIHPQLEVLKTAVGLLTLDPDNARDHNEPDLSVISDSYNKFGQRKPIVVRKDGMVVIAGNGQLMAAKRLGWTHIAAIVCDDDDTEAKAFALVDNRSAELSNWNDDVLGEHLSFLIDNEVNVDHLGWTAKEIETLASLDDEDVPSKTSDKKEVIEEDPIPDPPKDPITKPGDIWVLGSHRVICGDCTKSEVIDALFGDVKKVDLICTDPPYCSGGFRETGKGAGSVGTKNVVKEVANDKLSTRGYIALLKAAFNAVESRFMYAFTDWRMWTYLIDLTESSGFGCRSMIVWDKGNPGMGRGWRSQHELVMWSVKETPPYPDKWGGKGNVIQSSRTGNKLHTTEKPLSLMQELLKNAPFADIIFDPFGGSGTTLMAAEVEGKQCYITELDPAYVDTIVTRWESYTGKKAKHIKHGQ